MNAPAQGEARRLLLIEDDASFAQRLRRNLQSSGFEVDAAESVEAAWGKFAERAYDLVLTDIRLPGASGLDFLQRLSEQAEAGELEAPPVVVLTSIQSVDTAVEAMHKGASDYLTKEATRDEIVMRLEKVLERSELAAQNRQLRRTLNRYEEFEEIVGASSWSAQLKDQVKQIAASDVSVLVTGPTGVGKELVARAIHRTSHRAKGAFIEVNCAALPDENLFLSELFGHERGAFTGAVSRKRGHFEQADGGTLFLDEIGELGPQGQARLLRAVDTQQFTRLGGEKPIKVNARFIFATNRDLPLEVKEGRFRQDLFYRIAVYPIEVPPLRARPEDVAPLARFFAARMAEKHRLPAPTLSDDTLEVLRANPWPGNVRELRNVIERLTIRFAGKPIDPGALRELNLDGASGGGGTAAGTSAAYGAVILPEAGIQLEEVEESLVVQALQRAQWNQRKAAQLLGISVDRMNARVKKFGLSHPSWRVHK